MNKILGFGLIPVGLLFLFKAYSNVLAVPDAFSADGAGEGEYYHSGVLATIFFAVGGISVVLYGIRKIRKAKVEIQPKRTY